MREAKRERRGNYKRSEIKGYDTIIREMQWEVKLEKKEKKAEKKSRAKKMKEER